MQALEGSCKPLLYIEARPVPVDSNGLPTGSLDPEAKM